ncbi:MAG TPA: response regulator [Gemmatimonadales bacterium]|nr:response regulator [Gemmatimonadales bacterium]
MAEPLPVVLVVEDDSQMQKFLQTALVQHRYRPVEASTAREALTQHAGHHPDVILLDLGLPDGDGIDVARTIRAQSRTPIIVLSARGQEQDKVSALDAGADDYLTKPFGVEELLARLRVALRRAARPMNGDDSIAGFGDVRVDLEKREVRRGKEVVHLTPTEYRLLTTLVRHPGRVLTHRQLVREVWGAHTGDQTASLRVHMTQLRHKLEKDPARPRHLTTEIGVGYRLQID